MSFFGNLFKGVGKLVGGVAKTAVNLAGKELGVGAIFSPSSSATGGSPTDPIYSSSFSSTPVANPYGGANPPSIMQQFKDLLLVGSGNKPLEMTASTPALPSWLLPVLGIGGLGLLFMSMNKKK